MKKDINKIILKNVEMALAELDIDSMIEGYINNKAVKEEVRRLLMDKIAMTFQDKVLLKYRQQERIIDAWADNQLTGLFIKLGIK